MSNKNGVTFAYCGQCKVDCAACANNEVHMNTEPPFPGYDPSMSNANIDWAAHNSRGHHHVLWNGFENETVPCGSTRSTELMVQKFRHVPPHAPRIGNDDPIDGVNSGLAERLAERTLRTARQHGITQTVALLEVSDSTFKEISTKLAKADYVHAFFDNGNTIDVSGIALVRATHADPLDDPTVIKSIVGRAEQELADAEITSEDILARSKANSRQVGGSHYGGGKIQHWDLAVMFGWNWAQYQIIKYVMRYLDKNGLQDLDKADHFLEKLREEIRAGRMPEKRS